MNDQLIEKICKARSLSSEKTAHVDQTVISFFLKKTIDPQILLLNGTQLPASFFQRIIFFRDLLKLSLFNYWNQLHSFQYQLVVDLFYELSSQKKTEYTLECLYLDVCAYLLKLPVSPSLIDVKQQPNGMFSLSTQSHWNILTTPFIDLHAEFATLYFIYGKLKQSPQACEQSYRAAKWHCHFLQHNYLPFKGVFNNFNLCHYNLLIARQNSLFNVCALANEDTEMAYIADIHSEYLSKQAGFYFKDFATEVLMINRLVSELFPQQLTPTQPQTDKEIRDDTQLVTGVRSDDLNIILSLSHCNSSMGSLNYGSLEIAGFGVQQGILGEAKQFGFISEKPKNLHLLDYQSSEDFNLEGLVGLPTATNEAEVDVEHWQYPASWVRVNMHYFKQDLKIKLHPLSQKKDLFFSFFVIADQCLIKGQKKFLNHSLEQFEGKPTNVAFLSKNEILTVEPLNFESAMKIIPLEGRISFWGAKYLLAFTLDGSNGDFKYKISFRNR